MAGWGSSLAAPGQVANPGAHRPVATADGGTRGAEPGLSSLTTLLVLMPNAQGSRSLTGNSQNSPLFPPASSEICVTNNSSQREGPSLASANLNTFKAEDSLPLNISLCSRPKLPPGDVTTASCHRESTGRHSAFKVLVLNLSATCKDRSFRENS